MVFLLFFEKADPIYKTLIIIYRKLKKLLQNFTYVYKITPKGLMICLD